MNVVQATGLLKKEKPAWPSAAQVSYYPIYPTL